MSTAPIPRAPEPPAAALGRGHQFGCGRGDTLGAHALFHKVDYTSVDLCCFSIGWIHFASLQRHAQGKVKENWRRTPIGPGITKEFYVSRSSVGYETDQRLY